MTTVESADYLWRIEALLEAPAVVHGVSMEPLLGPITLPKTFLKLGEQAWVIAGGESGPGARATKIEWLRSLRDTCVSAGVPFHFKQWGEYGADGKKIGKKRAGRILDGREWNELPDYAACCG
jgi:protein gp37